MMVDTVLAFKCLSVFEAEYRDIPEPLHAEFTACMAAVAVMHLRLLSGDEFTKGFLAAAKADGFTIRFNSVPGAGGGDGA